MLIGDGTSGALRMPGASQERPPHPRPASIGFHSLPSKIGAVGLPAILSPPRRSPRRPAPWSSARCPETRSVSRRTRTSEKFLDPCATGTSLIRETPRSTTTPLDSQGRGLVRVAEESPSFQSREPRQPSSRRSCHVKSRRPQTRRRGTQGSTKSHGDSIRIGPPRSGYILAEWVRDDRSESKRSRAWYVAQELATATSFGGRRVRPNGHHRPLEVSRVAFDSARVNVARPVDRNDPGPDPQGSLDRTVFGPASKRPAGVPEPHRPLRRHVGFGLLDFRATARGLGR